MSWPEGGLKYTIMGIITLFIQYNYRVFFSEELHRKVESVGIIYAREEKIGLEGNNSVVV